MDQKTLFIVLGIISILILSGCIDEQKDTPPPAGLTAEEVRDKSIEAIDNVKSYAFDMDMSISAPVKEQGKATMGMTGKGRVDIENKRMYNKMDMGTMGMSTSTETYIIGDMAYIKSPSAGWMKKEADVGMWEAQDIVKSQKDLMKSIDVTLSGSEKVNGVDCYILVMKPGRDELIQLLTQEIGGTPGISATEIGEKIRSMEVREWIAKDTSLTRRSVTVMQMEAEGKLVDMTIRMDIYDYNKPMNIELPKEAEDAKDVT
jgi:outer membrane lipoprotein-sorting protein